MNAAMNAEVISKATGAVTNVAENGIDLTAPSIVRLDIARADVASVEQQANDLVIRTVGGEQVRIADFFPNDPALPNDLVLREENGSLWQARAASGTPRFSLIRDLDDLLMAQAAGGGSSLALPAALLGGVAAAGGLAAAAGGGGNDASGSQPGAGTGTGTAPDREAPAAPTASIDGRGITIGGRGEPGATLVVRDVAGGVVTSVVVGTDGTYSATAPTPQIAGAALTATQTDAAGNVSAATTFGTPDLTASPAPTAMIDATGTSVTGRGAAGDTVTIRDASGAVVATAIVAADGNYTATLASPQANGGTLSVTQTDAAGNVSPTTVLAAPDVTAPAQPTATVAGDGGAVTGTGEPGARITVVTAAGVALGSAIVASNGSYSVSLVPAQANGEQLGVVQTDPAGNAAPPLSLTAPDVTAPSAPVAAIDGTGTVVTGTGEPGARLSIRTATDLEIGTATVGPDGRYTAVLATAQVAAQSLTVVQTDAAGNASPPIGLVAPDLTAPGAPVAIVSADGTTVSGTGEAGATVSVRAPNGAVIGTAIVAADGSYTASLSPAQTDGETLTIRQTDTAGNVSTDASATAPDLVVDTRPDAPTAGVAADGTLVTGVAAPGAAVTLYDADGTVIARGVAAADGSYAVALAPALVDGETVRVTQTDADGDISLPATAVAPDLTAPALPTAEIAADGRTIIGTGEAGATVTVRGTGGIVLGAATVAADGSYAVVLVPAQANGEAVSVVQTDAAGNASAALSLVAPDITAPAAPVAALDATGAIVIGTGEPGARIVVTDAAGAVLGQALVTAQGNYSVALVPAQIDSQRLSVVQTDAAGNASPAIALVAPDLTAPTAPTATVDAAGTTLTGTGEAGATVTVRDPLGVVIGTATVGADGTFTVSLAPAQTDGEVLTVRQADAAGNVSPVATATAPDLVVDTDPPAPTAAVGADGTAVSGLAIAGAAITVYDAGGTVIATGVAASDGRYSVALSPARIDGETVRVTQTEADGDVSPPATATAPDLTAPPAPTGVLDGTGGVVTGTGEPGATIAVRAADGTLLGTATVTAGGAYAATLTPVQANGETISVAQADARGNVSPSIALVAADVTAPAAPVVTVTADGTAVTGSGEPGATATVRNAAGTILGTASIAGDGSFTVPLSPAQANGGTVSVTVADQAGNVSPPVTAAAPDITAPDAPLVQVAADGSAVSGTGEAGATIVVRDGAGTSIGTATVAADGHFTAVLTPVQANGGTVSVVQTDAAGNASLPATIVAPDLVVPAAPTLAVAADGGSATGTGEPGARIVVTGAAGVVLGVAVVAANGSYAASLATPQLNGERLAATQTDGGGNVSPPVTATAPDLTAPAAPTATIAADGASITGIGEAGATVLVSAAGGAPLGSAVVGSDGRYTVSLTAAQANGQTLAVSQTDAAGNASPAASVTAPDLTAPVAPIATIGGQGDVVTGLGEPGTTVRIATATGTILGSGVVATDGSYLVTLAPAQRNGEPVVVTLSDAAGNVSAPVTAVAPDLTAPPPPTVLAIAADGTSVTGTGEAGARVTVRDPANTVIGTAVVAADGSFTVGLLPAQVAGATLAVTQTDVAGNLSLPTAIVAPFDIDAFDNAAAASIDLAPATTPVNYGTAGYLALVSLGLVNLQAEVLTVEHVRFTVQPGHSLDAVFTYDALATIGAASGYAVVVQRLEGTQWVAVDGTGAASLLEIGLLNGNLSATDTLGPGDYRAFLTFQGAAGTGLLGGLTVAGTVADFTDVAAVTPTAAPGNVITDAGPGGAVDIVSPGTRVASVTIGGVTTAVAAGGSVVTGAWGSLAINPDGSYSYTPAASAAAIGHTDVFTYTLLDPTDGERESASLTITIGSPDITGAPVAIADQAIAAVTFAPVVTVVAPATAFTFSSQPAGLLQPSTGAGTGSFTVAANAIADVTVSAVRQPGLSVSLLPSYTLTVYDGATIVRTETRPSLAGLPIGTGTIFTIDDLPSGNYTYTVRSSAALGTFGTTVLLGSTTESLVDFTLSGRETATGNLLDNDVAHTPFAAIRVDAGGGFTEVGDTPVTLVGLHGTLTVDETGGYVYQPGASLGYSAVDLTDRFTYQLAQPDGTVASATLTVTIDVPADGVATPAAAMATLQMSHGEADVIPLDALTAHAGIMAVPVDAAAIGLATYGLFEGRGELEDVLSHYLGARQHDVAPDTAAASTVVSLDNASVHPVVDSLDYLVTLADQTQESQTIHHVI